MMCKFYGSVEPVRMATNNYYKILNGTTICEEVVERKG